MSPGRVLGLGATSVVAIAILALFVIGTCGCTTSYERVYSDLDIKHNGHEFVNLLTIESGRYTSSPLSDAFSHHSSREYQRQDFDLYLGRWDDVDGSLKSIEPFTKRSQEWGWTAFTPDETAILGLEVHRRIDGTWRQVNRDREYKTWSGDEENVKFFSLDHRRHLYLDHGRVEIREVATGRVVASRAQDDAWTGFLREAKSSRAFWVDQSIDPEGKRLLCRRSLPDGNEEVLVFELETGARLLHLIDLNRLLREPRTDFAVVEAVEMVAGKLYCLLMACEKHKSPGPTMIHLLVVTEDGEVRYDDQWRHEFQTSIHWDPHRSLLLMSNTSCESSDLAVKKTTITRIDYANGKESVFPIRLPSEERVRQAR